MSDNKTNPYRSPNYREKKNLKSESGPTMRTPHVWFLFLGAMATVFSVDVVFFYVPLALVVGPWAVRVRWGRLTGAGPQAGAVSREIAGAFVTTIPLILATFVTFGCVCTPTSQLVWSFDPIVKLFPGDDIFEQAIAVGKLVTAASMYLGLLIPFLFARSRGHYAISENEPR